MSKKILLIIGIIIILGLAALFIFRSKTSTVGEGGGFNFGNFLPFGNAGETITGTVSSSTTSNNQNVSSSQNTGLVQRLRKISNEQVAGAVIFNTGSTTFVRFVEKGTGNIYEANSNSSVVTRLTNTTIPKIIRAAWLPNGSGFLAQTLIPDSEIVETSFVKISKNTSTSTAENLTPYTTVISKLPTGIKEISVKPDSTKIFYYILDGNKSNWYLANPDGTGSSLVASNALTEWLPNWISANTIIMQTKSSALANSYLYSFDVTSKALRNFGLPALGLSSLPNSDGIKVLESSGGSNVRLFSIDSKNSTSTALSLNTLAEKCVWLNKDKSPAVICAIPDRLQNSSYPDVWYEGLISTEDSLTKADVKNDIYYNIADLSKISGQKIDVENPMISPDDAYLIFRNKIDGFLWMLKIED